MSKLYYGLKRFVREEDAPTFVEYGLAVVFIGLIAVIGAVVLGNGLSTLFSGVGGYISGSFDSSQLPT